MGQLNFPGAIVSVSCIFNGWFNNRPKRTKMKISTFMVVKGRDKYANSIAATVYFGYSGQGYSGQMVIVDTLAGTESFPLIVV